MLSRPEDTLTLPPPGHGGPALPVQDAGSVVPPNSSSTVAARMTSPSAICDTAVFAPVVPAEKPATVVSTSAREVVAKLAGAAGGLGDVAELVAASTDVTR